MRDTYSLYETKAKLSAIIRRVREGHRVLVTVHGDVVAEIRPVDAPGKGLDRRLDQLAERGILVRPDGERDLEPQSGRLRQVARRPGALSRFLRDRDG
ncbi:MAG: type II toxin-antitoxin system Phd/YefM family antitoxin [Gemmatimonadales bacterium]